jgi:hypothetical protein
MSISPTAMLKLAKFASFKTSDLQPQHIVEIAGTLGFQVDPTRVDEVMAFVRSENVDSLADWAGRPDNLQRLKDLLKPKEGDSNPVVKCPHCEGVFELYYEK